MNDPKVTPNEVSLELNTKDVNNAKKSLKQSGSTKKKTLRRKPQSKVKSNCTNRENPSPSQNPSGEDKEIDAKSGRIAIRTGIVDTFENKLVTTNKPTAVAVALVCEPLLDDCPQTDAFSQTSITPNHIFVGTLSQEATSQEALNLSSTSSVIIRSDSSDLVGDNSQLETDAKPIIPKLEIKSNGEGTGFGKPDETDAHEGLEDALLDRCSGETSKSLSIEVWRNTPGQKRKILCGQCKKTIYGSFYTFMAHINEVHGEKTNVCAYCNQKFTRKTYLKLHINNLHNGKKETCETCQKQFLTKHTLRKHIRDIHERVSALDCPHCPKTYKQESSLKDHIQLVHQSLPKHICPQCNKGFMSFKDKENHLQFVHLGKKAVKTSCPECGKKFTEAHLKKHIASVHRGLRFKCDDCGQEFNGKSVLARHKEVIHEKRRFRCTLCFAEYRDFSAWQKHHQSEHIGMRFPCTHCEREFKSQHAVKRHIETRHEGIRFACELCEKSFSQRAKLSSHIQVVHLGQYPHPCNFCGQGFIRPCYLKDHLLKVHQIIVDVVGKDETIEAADDGSEMASDEESGEEEVPISDFASASTIPAAVSILEPVHCGPGAVALQSQVVPTDGFIGEAKIIQTLQPSSIYVTNSIQGNMDGDVTFICNGELTSANIATSSAADLSDTMNFVEFS